jgi:hypothetical protein
MRILPEPRPSSLLGLRQVLLRAGREVTDATTLALLIARSGAAGMSREDLANVLRLSPETVENLLRAMTAAGQVAVLKVNGQIVYRAAG